ncbi:hypothetical protein KQX54_011450 [Cotesia glomerata]|uniref:Uncharacterized protein n=1 Tax=Cotesia glomerata TaxID=32391 RepID=A0AAV7IS50_COTGL|nr:hypothetical protein KQX54_011450 [Cotesia glomerata]
MNLEYALSNDNSTNVHIGIWLEYMRGSVLTSLILCTKDGVNVRSSKKGSMEMRNSLKRLKLRNKVPGYEIANSVNVKKSLMTIRDAELLRNLDDNNTSSNPLGVTVIQLSAER